MSVNNVTEHPQKKCTKDIICSKLQSEGLNLNLLKEALGTMSWSALIGYSITWWMDQERMIEIKWLKNYILIYIH